MAGTLDFAGMVPGFDFLQNLMKGAGAALPPMGQWVAPTLDPEELDKRIQELRTVQFWLDQNAKLLGTTIQALEVQRMTLATLKSMNMPMADLKDALSIKAPPADAAPAQTKPAADSSAAAPAVDPLKWWGALTEQFGKIAAQALQPPLAATPGAASAAAPEEAVPRKAGAKSSDKSTTTPTATSAAKSRRRATG